MHDSNAGDVAHQNCDDVEKNAGIALKIFTAYYREHNHSGKVYDEMPNFFLVKPGVLEGKELPQSVSKQTIRDRGPTTADRR